MVRYLDPVITRLAFDIDDVPITDPEIVAHRYLYTAIVTRPFPVEIAVTVANHNATNTVDPSFTPTATFQVVSVASPSISGSFQLRFNDRLLTNSTSATQEGQAKTFSTKNDGQEIEKIMFNQFGITVRVENIVSDYSHVYLIHFEGAKGVVPPLTILEGIV